MFCFPSDFWEQGIHPQDERSHETPMGNPTPPKTAQETQPGLELKNSLDP